MWINTRVRLGICFIPQVEAGRHGTRLMNPGNVGTEVPIDISTWSSSETTPLIKRPFLYGHGSRPTEELGQ